MDQSKLIFQRGEEVRKEMVDSKRGELLTSEMLEHIDRFHSLDEIIDKDIDEAILLDELENIKNPKQLNFEKGIVTFTPSSASKCERELYYKALNATKDEQLLFPYQKRWVRNGTAVHRAMQKDLLYAEVHLKDPAFTVERLENGRPAWEHNLKDVKQFEAYGQRFQLFGMMDGILKFKDGSRIGFEFKTKSTTISAVGNYLMKDAQEDHKQQAIAYSLLFGIDEFIFVYESIAKDSWTKGEEAKADLRAFYFRPTEEQKKQLLRKFALVAKHVEKGKLPAHDFPNSCLFCPFKTICEKDGGYDSEAVAKEKRRKEEQRKRKAEERKAVK